MHRGTVWEQVAETESRHLVQFVLDYIEKGSSKCPRAQIVYTLAPKYVYRNDFKAKVYNSRVPGTLGGSDKMWLRVERRRSRSLRQRLLTGQGFRFTGFRAWDTSLSKFRHRSCINVPDRVQPTLKEHSCKVVYCKLV